MRARYHDGAAYAVFISCCSSYLCSRVLLGLNPCCWVLDYHAHKHPLAPEALILLTSALPSCFPLPPTESQGSDDAVTSAAVVLPTTPSSPPFAAALAPLAVGGTIKYPVPDAYKPLPCKVRHVALHCLCEC